jgi:hypothetical protein
VAGQGLGQLGVLLGDEEEVDAVVEHLEVVGGQHLVFPLLRGGGLDDHDPGAVALPVGALDDLVLEALDVDLEEVDRSVGGVLVEDGGQRGDRHVDGVHGHVLGPVLRRQALVERGQAGVVDDVVELQVAGLEAHGRPEVDVAGPVGGDLLGQVGEGLDVDPAPAGLVEVLGDRVDDRVVGADVDVEALVGVDRRQGPPEDDVLRVLCVREHRGAVLSGVRDRRPPHPDGWSGHGFPTIAS